MRSCEVAIIWPEPCIWADFFSGDFGVIPENFSPPFNVTNRRGFGRYNLPRCMECLPTFCVNLWKMWLNIPVPWSIWESLLQLNLGSTWYAKANHFLMDGTGEPPICYVMIWSRIQLKQPFSSRCFGYQACIIFTYHKETSIHAAKCTSPMDPSWIELGIKLFQIHEKYNNEVKIMKSIHLSNEENPLTFHYIYTTVNNWGSW